MSIFHDNSQLSPYSKFINKKYHLGGKTSSYLAGATYDVSMVLSPFLGGIIVSEIHYCFLKIGLLLVFCYFCKNLFITGVSFVKKLLAYGCYKSLKYYYMYNYA